MHHSKDTGVQDRVGMLPQDLDGSCHVMGNRTTWNFPERNGAKEQQQRDVTTIRTCVEDFSIRNSYLLLGRCLSPSSLKR
eukprot:scaffold22603_cov116-Cylindrotheca_fusiformis.AAC.6